MADFTIVAGCTDPLTIQCKNTTSAGVTSVVDLTGYTTIEMHLHPIAGGSDLTFLSTDDSPKVAYGTRASGEVVFSPASNTFPGPATYHGRLILTDPSGKTVPFPSADHFEFKVELR